MTGAWGTYAGERIMVGPAESFRDDLGIKIREQFEEGAAEALRDGRSTSESFERQASASRSNFSEAVPAS